MRKPKKTSLRVGDRVVRNKAVGSTTVHRGDLGGTVLKLTPVAAGSGGTRARVRVRWDTGHEASVEDRQLVRVRRGLRFVASPRLGQYGVWSGDEQIGHVTKIVHEAVIRGLNRVVFAWQPSTLDRRDLPAERTRDAAATALWSAREATR